MPLFLIRILELFESARAAVHRRLGRWVRLLPWASLAYGLVSGVTITRDYEHSTALVRYMVTLVVASILLRWWLGLKDREAPGLLGRVGVFRELLARHTLVADLGLGITQYAVQYIGMFCLPMLFMAEAWWTFSLTILIVASTLWDGWWERLAKHFWYLAAVRATSAVLAGSFAFAVIFPRQLAYFHPALALLAVLATIPWHRVADGRTPLRAELAPLAAALGIVLIQVSVDAWLRVPLLSVWLKKPEIGLNIRARQLQEPWGRDLPRARLSQALAAGDNVCCVSPVVSPSGVLARVVHEWRADDRVIDRITLPEVRGGGGAEGKEPAFRTFSCKKHLPPPATVGTIECLVYLEPAIFLGRVRVKLH